jgi:hypothetical protein
MADGFTSPPQEVVLQIFICLKNSWLSARFEPTNLGSNGKQTKMPFWHVIPLSLIQVLRLGTMISKLLS